MTKKLKISILCHNMSDNCLGRAYILERVLSRHYDVEIIGPGSSQEIWGPLRADEFIKYKVINSKNPLKALAYIDGQIIYAIKPRGTSFGYGLLAKLSQHKPLILDIDDWEMSFFLGRILGRIYNASRIWDLNSLLYTWLLEKEVGQADSITVSNQFLQKRFGGVLIPHFRDTNQFNPERFNQQSLKKEFGLQSQKVILFLGTPRKHKGIMELVHGIEKLGRKEVKLVIIGATDQDRKQLPSKPFLQILGQQPFTDIPKFIAMADIVTIFQAASRSSQGQLPAKVFDAMSMAKPIIASNVSDLPKVLEGCGEIVEAGDIEGLSNRIAELLDNPKYAQELGKRARQKCIEEYSYDAIAPKLHAVVEGVLAKARADAKA